MKRNDDLMRLAFGELSDAAARAVAAGVDDADRQEVEAYRSLREGLRLLPPPPPDNLSAERLRAAILDRDLVSRRRPLAWLPSLVAPLVLAGLAAVVVLPRLRPRAEPQIVTAMDDARFAQPVETPRFDLDFRSQVPQAARALPVAKTVATPVPQASSERVASRRRLRRHSVAPVVDPVEEGKGYLTMVVPGEDETASAKLPVMTKPQPETISAPPSSVVENASGMPKGAETVVIVSAKRDLETGAPAATEKEASSVLVGG